MNKILNIQQSVEVSQKLKKENKTIVLTGGCFDILHSGHIAFLQKAKEQGDVLFVMLESDESIKKLKGARRPVNDQIKRAHVLATLSEVDYVILLPKLNADSEYDTLVKDLNPDVLATTKNDPFIVHKKRQAQQIGAKVVEVIDRIHEHSTTGLINNTNI